MKRADKSNKVKKAQEYFGQGCDMYDDGDYEGALKCYNEAIILKPSFAMAIYSRGNTKFALHDHAGAIEDYSKAIDLNSKNHNLMAHAQRGLAYAHLGKYDKAINDFTLVKEVDQSRTVEMENRIKTCKTKVAERCIEKIAHDDIDGAWNDYIQANISDLPYILDTVEDYVKSFASRSSSSVAVINSQGPTLPRSSTSLSSNLIGDTENQTLVISSPSNLGKRKSEIEHGEGDKQAKAEGEGRG
jgi:tetratricopeptide (TPR) repeat protein